MANVNRQFTRIEEGLVHLRVSGKPGDQPPILMLHPSPASSEFLLPIIAAAGDHRHVFAPDTLGNGDSAAPALAAPDMAYYADSVRRLLDALEIEQCDVFGAHTGAHIAIELALQAPERIRGVTFDGVLVLDDDDREQYLKHYAPPQTIDQFGSQLNWAWHYVRDQMIFFPHFRKDDAHMRVGGSLDADYLHALTVNLLRNITHYHKTYHAVFNHDVLPRVAQLNQSLAIVTGIADPLANAVEFITKVQPDARVFSAATAEHDDHLVAVLEALSHMASQ